MRTKGKTKALAVWAAILMMAAVLTACGKTAVPEKEFKSENEIISMKMSAEWEAEEMMAGMEGWIAAGNSIGSEAIMVAQFPKNGLDMDTVITEMEKNYEIVDTDSSVLTGLEISGLSVAEAYACKIMGEGMDSPAYVAYGESDYAYYSFIYIANKLNDKRLDYFKACCATFQENAPEVEKVSDTILWFNATNAILTTQNRQDYNLFGGVAADEANAEMQKQSLEEWWGVTDEASAEENIEWVLTEGHRTGFAEAMESFGADGMADTAAEDRVDFLLENYEISEEDAEMVANYYNIYEEKGINAISAWDYSRAMSLFSWYYIAGYYTKEEALDASLELAKTIQENFDSWDSFMESYFLGYEYWAEEDSADRREIYEELKAASDSPYNLDWNLTFEKSW